MCLGGFSHCTLSCSGHVRSRGRGDCLRRLTSCSPEEDKLPVYSLRSAGPQHNSASLGDVKWWCSTKSTALGF